MGTIEASITAVIEKIGPKFLDDPNLKALEQASQEFEELVKRGYASKRGYNLPDASNLHIKSSARFNALAELKYNLPLADTVGHHTYPKLNKKQ